MNVDMKPAPRTIPWNVEAAPFVPVHAHYLFEAAPVRSDCCHPRIPGATQPADHFRMTCLPQLLSSSAAPPPEGAYASAERESIDKEEFFLEPLWVLTPPSTGVPKQRRRARTPVSDDEWKRILCVIEYDLVGATRNTEIYKPPAFCAGAGKTEEYKKPFEGEPPASRAGEGKAMRPDPAAGD
ncbi:unnamed protein product [Polarella glacialis]|uniref:Uncharacterized protein n=1 Tax=Polarella glacialis TaxID=89957 RepID=A0A813G219_POLGL|nr:unnamed protein product [Polarella glacialis]